MKLLIAGGGTGGHVLPGIAVAEVWKKEFGHDVKSDILFVGAQGKIEEKIVPQAGYRLELLRVGTLNRVSLRQKIKTWLTLPGTLFRAAQILIRFKPTHILGVGGFASGPILITAWLLDLLNIHSSKRGILESNSIAGLTNRLLSRFVHQIFTNFPETQNLPVSKIVCTGNPIRAAMTQMPKAPNHPFQIFIFGGSLGAVGLNTLVIRALPILKSLPIQIVHQTGNADFERVSQAYLKEGVSARIERFIDQMADSYKSARLIICRAGSSTLSELSAVGRAAILVPLPTAADNHQEWNARSYERAKAGICLLQESKPELLVKYIQEFMLTPERIDEIELNVQKFLRPHAALEVIQYLARDTEPR